MGLGPPPGRKSYGSQMLAAAQDKANGLKVKPTPKRSHDNTVVFERKKQRSSDKEVNGLHFDDPGSPARPIPVFKSMFDNLDLSSPTHGFQKDPLPTSAQGSCQTYPRWQSARLPALPAGMLNLGNTCYLNAVLQALFSLPTLVADLQSLGQKLAQAATVAGPQQGRSLPALPASGVCAGLLECLAAKGSLANDKSTVNGSNPFRRSSPVGGSKYIMPASLKAAIEARSAAFMGCFQQDAHEFMCQLLQGIQDEVLACEAALLGRRQVRIGETADPVARNLSLALEHQLSCSACGHQSRMVEQYTHLSLELPEGDFSDPASVPPDVASLLKSYFKEEAVEKSCEACGAANVRHSLSHGIRRLPRVLALHLKRFKVVAGSSAGAAPTCQKVHTPVGLAEALRLRPFTTQDCRPPLPASPACKAAAAGKENIAGNVMNGQQQPQHQSPWAAASMQEQTPAAITRAAPGATVGASHGLEAQKGSTFYSGGQQGTGVSYGAPMADFGAYSPLERANTIQLHNLRTASERYSPVERADTIQLRNLRIKTVGPAGGEGMDWLQRPSTVGAGGLEFLTLAAEKKAEEELQRVLELSKLEYEQQHQQEQELGNTGSPAMVFSPTSAAVKLDAVEEEDLQKALALSLLEQQHKQPDISTAAADAAGQQAGGQPKEPASPAIAGQEVREEPQAVRPRVRVLNLTAAAVMPATSFEHQSASPENKEACVAGPADQQEEGIIAGSGSPLAALGPAVEIVEDDWQPSVGPPDSADSSKVSVAAGVSPGTAEGKPKAGERPGSGAGSAGKPLVPQQLLAQYRLVATVSHMGAGASSGHFTADTKDEGSGSWFSHNDSLVSRISGREALGLAAQRQGYLLFYAAAWSDL